MATSTATRRAKGTSAQTRPARRLFNVEEYYRMAKAGIFGLDERVELLGGEIYQMAAMGSPHVASILELNEWFVLRVTGRARVAVQLPLRISSRWEPVPDLMLLRPREDRYESAKPAPEDVVLIVEVSDTTLRQDQRVKLPRYAAAAIPEAWILDLRSKRLLVHREPREDVYTRVETLGREDSIAPVAFPELLLPLEAILR